VSSPELHVVYKLANAPLQHYPFPHLYARDVFPADYYAQMQRLMPPASALKTLHEARGAKGYPDRFVLALGGDLPESLSAEQREFWRDFARWAFRGRLGPAVLGRFAPIVEQRLQENPGMEISDELLMVRDRTRYSLGPHTDAPAKVVSVLFYVPADDRLARHGTSVYVPKAQGFTHDGRGHLSFDQFERVATMPFLPNSVFAFAKTDTSFHGVEPVTEDGVERNLILYDLQLRPAAPVAASGPQVRFSI
jgi:hypothetical protein